MGVLFSLMQCFLRRFISLSFIVTEHLAYALTCLRCLVSLLVAADAYFLLVAGMYCWMYVCCQVDHVLPFLQQSFVDVLGDHCPVKYKKQFSVSVQQIMRHFQVVTDPRFLFESRHQTTKKKKKKKV